MAIIAAVVAVSTLIQPCLAIHTQQTPHSQSPSLPLGVRSLYKTLLAGRPAILNYSEALGANPKGIDPLYLHAYAFVGDHLLELPLRVYSTEVGAKFVKGGVAVKLYFRGSGSETPKYVEVWLPR